MAKPTVSPVQSCLTSWSSYLIGSFLFLNILNATIRQFGIKTALKSHNASVIYLTYCAISEINAKFGTYTDPLLPSLPKVTQINHQTIWYQDSYYLASKVFNASVIYLNYCATAEINANVVYNTDPLLPSLEGSHCTRKTESKIIMFLLCHQRPHPEKVFTGLRRRRRRRRHSCGVIFAFLSIRFVFFLSSKTFRRTPHARWTAEDVECTWASREQNRVVVVTRT